MAKSKPVLSILVPAITERMDKLKVLLERLELQATNLPIEVLSFVDNRRRSIGMKRDALLLAARGKYVVFVDDDDWVADNYASKIYFATEDDPDVVTFDSESTLNGEEPFIVSMSLENKVNEQAHKFGGKWQNIKRPPWHVCAWRREISQPHRFPDINYGEDWKWVEKFIQYAESEVHIDEVLHYYRYDDAVTRAT